MGRGADRNDPCPCGSGQKVKRCCPEGAPSPANTSDATLLARTPLTLLIETPDGLMTRRVPQATSLPPTDDYGHAAEQATHDAAAAWGLPDFVYLPKSDSRGSRNRELGDGTIIVGDLGIALQVKGREAPSDDPEKERRWIEKKTRQALSQANGSIRSLCAQPASLTSLRGRTQAIDGQSLRWYSVVVFDHPNPPGNLTPSLAAAKHPALVLTRGDWEFLFDQLKSTHAVAAYVARVAGEPGELGSESGRYYDCALADATTAPEPADPRLLALGGTSVSTPMLPLEPAAHGDRAAHQVVRAIMEDVATARFTKASDEMRLRMLAELDRLPVGQRGGIGQYLLDGMAQVENGEWTDWRLRSIRGVSGRLNLGFGTLGRPHSSDVEHGFQLWLRLRHYDLLQVADQPEDFVSVAVLLTPRTRGRRRWDTTMAACIGSISFSDSELRTLRELWPTPQSAAA